MIKMFCIWVLCYGARGIASHASTMPCTTENPRPVPCPTERVVKNGSNLRSTVTASIPCAVSLTQNSTRDGVTASSSAFTNGMYSPISVRISTLGRAKAEKDSDLRSPRRAGRSERNVDAPMFKHYIQVGAFGFIAFGLVTDTNNENNLENHVCQLSYRTQQHFSRIAPISYCGEH